MRSSFVLDTESNGLVDITDKVLAFVAETGLSEGLVLVSVPHSTAAVTTMSPWDPKGLEDVQDEIERLVPTRVDFKHQFDTPQDAAGHVKAAIVGHERSFFIDGGKLGLGASQHIYFWEFDGPRRRRVDLVAFGDRATA